MPFYTPNICAAAEHIVALYVLGPDYQSTFSATEWSAVLAQAPGAAAALTRGKDALAPRLLLAYNAQVRAQCIALLLRRCSAPRFLGTHRWAVRPSGSCVRSNSMAVCVAVQASVGRLLYDIGEMERGSGGDSDGGAAVALEGAQLCTTTRLRDILHCLGGVAVLLPLLTQLDLPLHPRSVFASP